MPIPHRLGPTLTEARQFSRLYVLVELSKGLDPVADVKERPKLVSAQTLADLISELETVWTRIDAMRHDYRNLVREAIRFDMIASPFGVEHFERLSVAEGAEFKELQNRFEDYREANPHDAPAANQAESDWRESAIIMATSASAEADELSGAISASISHTNLLRQQAEEHAWDLIESNTRVPMTVAEQAQQNLKDTLYPMMQYLATDPEYLRTHTGVSIPGEELDDQAFDLLMDAAIHSLGWKSLAANRQRGQEVCARFPQTADQSLTIIQQADSLVFDPESTRALESVFELELDSIAEAKREYECRTFPPM